MSSTQPDGYLALPASGTGKGVLVLHAWWGLNATFKAVCNRLAEAGFVAFAPDLYHGKVTDQIAEAETLATAQSRNGDQARADLAAATAFLTERSDASGLAVIGFSMGANYALNLSVTAPDAIRSVVLFYGTDSEDFSKSKASYLGHFAETDEYESPADVASLEESLKQAGRPVTFYTYPGTGHWFFEPNRPRAYNQAAANLAWERTLTFLQQG
jgi:carboxymethylenebutenolidase